MGSGFFSFQSVKLALRSLLTSCEIFVKTFTLFPFLPFYLSFLFGVGSHVAPDGLELAA